MNIGFACDHAGFELKIYLVDALKKLGYTVTDYGTYSTESVDYPDFAQKLAYAIQENEVSLGIAICSTGNGINMALNRHHGVRAALCWLPQLAELARQHNNANVCTLPGNFVEKEFALQIVLQFLKSDFEGGRHLRRVDKIDC